MNTEYRKLAIEVIALFIENPDTEFLSELLSDRLDINSDFPERTDILQKILDEFVSDRILIISKKNSILNVYKLNPDYSTSKIYKYCKNRFNINKNNMHKINIDNVTSNSYPKRGHIPGTNKDGKIVTRTGLRKNNKYNPADE